MQATKTKTQTMQEEKAKLKKQYFAQKKVLDTLRDNVTLKRWQALSKAYKLGKKVWGMKFTRERLASDMELPYSTVLRCLALDRTNDRTWDLIKQKKISAFKVAQICMSKNVTYQDEVVDMVIEDNLSTYEIQSLKIKGIQDISKEKHRLACEKGYSRADSAYTNFERWIDRGNIFMLLDKKNIPQSKLTQLKSKLKALNKKIERYTA